MNNHKKIREAIQQLEKEREPINVAAVARKAEVVTRTVYRSPYIEEIQALRIRTKPVERPYLKDMQTQRSADRRLESALDQIDKLKLKILQLKEEKIALEAQLDKVILSARK